MVYPSTAGRHALRKMQRLGQIISAGYIMQAGKLHGGGKGASTRRRGMADCWMGVGVLKLMAADFRCQQSRLGQGMSHACMQQ